MVRSGHHLDRAGGSDPALTRAGISTITLREISSDPTYRFPLLLKDHLLILVTGGHGTHEVDFHTHQCRPGSLIWVRPGQVIRYGGQPGLDATIVAWRPEALAVLGCATPTPTTAGPGYWQLAGEDEDAVINEVSQLVVDCQRHHRGGPAVDLLRHQLAVLLHRLALLTPIGQLTDGSTAGATAVTFQRLRDEIERSYRDTRRVEDYAIRMECSVRTLTRACLAATGQSAKQVVDDRVTLEAMRLLAATDVPIAEIGRRLGFPEPTNFGRFFQREAGQSPGAFRDRLRGATPD